MASALATKSCTLEHLLMLRMDNNQDFRKRGKKKQPEKLTGSEYLGKIWLNMQFKACEVCNVCTFSKGLLA